MTPGREQEIRDRLAAALPGVTMAEAQQGIQALSQAMRDFYSVSAEDCKLLGGRLRVVADAASRPDAPAPGI